MTQGQLAEAMGKSQALVTPELPTYPPPDLPGSPGQAANTRMVPKD
jgi:hypothetical protein